MKKYLMLTASTAMAYLETDMSEAEVNAWWDQKTADACRDNIEAEIYSVCWFEDCGDTIERGNGAVVRQKSDIVVPANVVDAATLTGAGTFRFAFKNGLVRSTLKTII